MTILVYSGTVGSGKSLHAASDIRYDLNRRYPRPCLANFALGERAPVRHPELFTHVPNSELTVDRLVDFADGWWSEHEFREDHINLVLDEVALLFNSRLWAESNRMEFLEFMSQSRKYGYKVILIAQNIMMIDNQMRMLCDYDVNHRKVGSFGPVGALLSTFAANRAFLRVTYLMLNGKQRERLGMRWYFARNADFAMYDSYARFRRKTEPQP